MDDPGFPPALDLIRARAAARAGAADDDGPLPEGLAALAAGCGAVLTTLRAQNPTGAAARPAWPSLRVLDAHPEVVVVEDDHAGPVAGAPGVTLAAAGRPAWAHVRSVSKWLGPDLRLALLTGDPQTVARSRAASWSAPAGSATCCRGWPWPRGRRRAACWSGAARPTRRREALASALAARGIRARPLGLNVWVPVAEEGGGQPAALDAGWAVLAGERFRLRSASPRSALPCPCSMSTTPRDSPTTSRPRWRPAPDPARLSNSPTSCCQTGRGIGGLGTLSGQTGLGHRLSPAPVTGP